MKKKFFGFVLSLCLIIPCLIMLTACTQPSDEEVNPVGTYYVSEVTMTTSEGTGTITLDEYNTLKTKSETTPEDMTMEESMELVMYAMFFEQSWVFSDEHTYSILSGDEHIGYGDWSYEDNTIWITASDSEDSQEISVNGNVLTYSYSESGESVTMKLTKVQG